MLNQLSSLYDYFECLQSYGALAVMFRIYRVRISPHHYVQLRLLARMLRVHLDPRLTIQLNTLGVLVTNPTPAISTK